MATTVRRLFGRGDDGQGSRLSADLRRVAVVGESRYQEALAEIAGGYRPRSQRITTNAVVLRQPGNPHDANAIVVAIGGRVVGYLPRREAADYAPLLDAAGLDGLPCHAEIRGGWKDASGRGDFGVVVWLPPAEAGVFGRV